MCSSSLAFELVLGQGYIWRINKTPGNDKWELVTRSHKMWEHLAESMRQQGLDPSEILGWKKTGRVFFFSLIQVNSI